MEIDVWHTESKMLEKKYLIYCIITYDACNNLVFELTPFLQSLCLNLVLSQLEIRKIVAIVIYRVNHGYRATHLANRVNVRASTIRKYFDIMIDVLPNRNKLLSKYIKFLLENICNRLEILLKSAQVCLTFVKQLVELIFHL